MVSCRPDVDVDILPIEHFKGWVNLFRQLFLVFCTLTEKAEKLKTNKCTARGLTFQPISVAFEEAAIKNDVRKVFSRYIYSLLCRFH